MTSVSTTIKFDGAAIDDALAELRLLLPKIAQRSPQVVDRFVGLIESGAELFMIELDRRVTADASELVIRAQPTDGFRILMSALRAGNLDLATVEQAFGHGASSAQSRKDSASEGVAS